MTKSGNKSMRGQLWMRWLAVVFVAGSVPVTAQTVTMIKEDAPPPAMPAFKTASPNSVRVSANVLQGMAAAEPDISALRGGLQQGAVGLRVLVSKTGAVQEVIPFSGPEELRKAAVDGVMGWSYQPYTVNGEPREVQSTILLSFRDGVGKRAVFGVPGTGGVAGYAGAAPPVVERRPPPGSVRVSSAVVAGLAEDRPAPVYPPIARAAHVQGVVVLHAILSKTGDVEDIMVISGPPMLTGAAVDAVRKWKYRPYLLNGVPVEVDTTINVNFQFAEPPKQPEGAGDAGSAESGQEAPVRVSAGTMAGLALERPEPICSAAARAEHASGMVILHAIISKQGTVKDVQVISAAESLQECSLAAVRQWRYRPYLVDGVPKEVETTIMIHMLFGGKGSQEDAK